jgi:hypothetical protein
MTFSSNLNKGSYRLSKVGFQSLLLLWKIKYRVESEVIGTTKFYIVYTEKGVLRVDYKRNGWLTIT